METKEAIIYIKAIEKGLYESGKDSPYRDELIPKMKEACNVALKALQEKAIFDEVRTKIMSKDGLEETLEIIDECKLSKLERAKEVIKKYFDDGCCGIFDSRNVVGDLMTTIYQYEDLTIDICYDYQYFEVFGLTDEEFEELCEYYCSLEEE